MSDLDMDVAVAVKWKPIADAPEYEVSDDGRVRHGNREMALSVSSKGYPQCHLWVNGKRKVVSVHREVLIRAMRRDHRNGLGCTTLGRKYDVDKTTAHRAVTGRSWAHVK